MKNKKYVMREVTPRNLGCGIGACNKIYELKNLTPEEMNCLFGGCPAIYSKDNDFYLIIGKTVEPAKFGLEKRVGEGEALVLVPRKLIDNKTSKV